MSAEDRLKRLNAYLIAKGKQPKSATPINYVTRNISRYDATPRSNKSASSTQNRKSLKNHSKPQKDTSLKGSTPARVDPNLLSNRREQKSKKSPVSSKSAHNVSQRTPLKGKENYIDCTRKKLVRRSIVTKSKRLSQSARKTTPRRPKFKSSMIKNSSTPSCLNTSLRRKVFASVCKSVGSTPKSSKIAQSNSDKEENYKPLNNWLMLKGKKPFTTGFKAVKTIQTPVGSPSESPRLTPSSKSHWQGLRDEDDLDEIAVLIRKSMEYVKSCIDEGCPVSILKITLQELSVNFPKVEKHAPYWITLALIEQSAGSEYEAICDIYEKAIVAKATPISEIRESLNNWLLHRMTEKTEAKTSNPSRSVPTNQTHIPHPGVRDIQLTNSPAFKNAATSPIVFESPLRAASPSTPHSPSSVVKLRIVSRSSPIFNRHKSFRALPNHTKAIITPVRRSVRIAASQMSYPKGLLDHEPCLSSVQEIFPCLKQETEDAKSSLMSCDVVYNPNLALESNADIATVLNF